jgi:hypothetical protein
MKRIRIVINDVFSVTLNNNNKKYFQYVAIDNTMLGSSVIVAFKKEYGYNDSPELEKIIKDEVDFYAHLFIGLGYKMNLWEKVGNVKSTKKIDCLFRDCLDYGIKAGEESNDISEKWRVWRINEPMKFVGKLEGENRKAEIGMVMPPQLIVERIWTGKYNMMFSGYDEGSVLRYVPTPESKEIMERINKVREAFKKK